MTVIVHNSLCSDSDLFMFLKAVFTLVADNKPRPGAHGPLHDIQHTRVCDF